MVLGLIIMYRIELVTFILLLLTVATPGQNKRVVLKPIAIINVTLITMKDDLAITGQTVIVRKGVIERIGPSKIVPVPIGSIVIDGTNRFLTPALWDMHVHLTLAGESSLPVFIANGVTAVRDMGGDLERIDRWRDAINSSKLVGPYIYRAGPYVDGPKNAPDRITVTTDVEARAAVRMLKRKGVDFIKIHNAVPRTAIFAVFEEATKLGMRVAGHIPLDITPIEASNAGQGDFEHMTSLIEGAVTAAQKRGESPANAVNAFDDHAASELFQAMAKNGTWMTPNLIAENAITFRGDARFDTDPGLKYISPELKRYWDENFTGKPTAARKLLFQRYLALVTLMQKDGVRLLAGTDLGLRDIYPGFSLHEELELLVNAGLTPYEAMKTATVNPAKYFGVSEQYGTIEVRHHTDLILLDGNPLTDIKNTRKISEVIFNGKRLRRSDLDELLKTGERLASGGTR